MSILQTLSGIIWIVMTGAMSIFIPAFIKLIHTASTGDPLITFYGFQLEDGKIDETHLIAGYCCWITIVVICWLFMIWWKYPCQCVARRRDKLRRLFGKLRHQELRAEEIILSDHHPQFTVVDDDDQDEEKQSLTRK